MKILLSSLSGQLGGMELRLADEARFLTEKGTRCAIAVSPFPGRDAWLSDVINEGAGSISRFDFDPPTFFETWRARRARQLAARCLWLPRLRRQRFDLCHVFSAWTLQGMSQLWLSHAAHIPTVLSVHNCFPKQDLSFWHRRLAADAFSTVRGIYAVTPSALASFCETFGDFIAPTTRVAVVPNFVDTRRFFGSELRRRQLRTDLGIPMDALVLGSVGRISSQKDPFRVLEVFAQVHAVHPRTHLIYCGQGELERDLRSFVLSQPYRTQVHFLGFRKDTESIYPALDIHLLLSTFEGFGISTIEALACEVPVLATDIPATRDVLSGTDAGRLVASRDTQQAVAAALDLINNPTSRRTAGLAGRRLIEAKYSKDAWRKKLSSFYDTLSLCHRSPARSTFS